jgi:hypothetical protein
MATKRFLRYRISLVVVAAVAATATFAVASASASLQGEVESVVKSVVPPVAAPTPPSLPPVPAPPSLPPAPVTPAPQAPADVPAELPRSPSEGGTSKAAKEATAAVPSPSGKAEEVALPAHSGGAIAPQGEEGTGATAVRKRANRRAPASVRPAREAPPQHWRARVWPAIELGSVRPVLAALATLVRREGGGRPLRVSDGRQLVLGISRSSGDPAPAARGAPLVAPDYGSLPSDRESLLLVALYFATMLALAASTIWVKLRAWYR